MIHLLPRLHWLEVHEQPWCPSVLRTFLQSFLRWMWEAGDLVPPVVPILAKALRATGATHIVDLCSGGGGPHRLLLPQLQAALGNDNNGEQQLTMTLTDLWPHVEGWKEFTAGVPGLSYEPQSVDATAVPPTQKGFRTLFTCLHHFQPELVQGMLADAVQKGEGVGIFEVTSRDTRSCLMLLTVGVFTTWLYPLLRRPFRLDYFLLSTVLPFGPLLNMHDGFVSCLRTYNLAEMQAMVESVKGHENYEWEFGVRPWAGSGLLSVLGSSPYMIGIPKKGNGSKKST